MPTGSFRLIVGAMLGVLFAAAPASAQSLNPNQTEGFGNNKLLTFSYTQSFDCVDEPTDDLNFNSILAQSEPAESQLPICQAGTETKIDPAGGPIKKTAHLYVLVPMFSVDNDQNAGDAISCTGVVAGTLCGSALGSELITLFGALPEAFKATPLVATQCPGTGFAPGTCTMHASRVDLAPVLAAMGKISSPPTENVFVPTPNHSHIVDNGFINRKAIWWEVRPVLVLDPADFPPLDGSSGITSVKKMDAAEKAGNAVEVGSNFFLFFSSEVMGHKHGH
jgi:hypothetical protein